MNKPELLAPAGSLEKAKTAFRYGADAVYMGTSNLSLRSRVTVDDDELIKTIEYAHSINKKVYAALNIYARDNMYEEIENQINILKKAKVDAYSSFLCASLLRRLGKRLPVGDMSAGFKSVRVKIRCTVHIRFSRTACDVLVLIKRQHRDTYLRQPLTARNPPYPLQRLHAHSAGFVHLVHAVIMLPVFRVQNFNCSVNRHRPYPPRGAEQRACSKRV